MQQTSIAFGKIGIGNNAIATRIKLTIQKVFLLYDNS